MTDRKIFRMHPVGPASTLQVPLWRAGHGRTGDKGNRSNISVIAWHDALWPVLVSQVTAARVRELFGYRNPAGVQRFLLPTLCAMNFVIDEVLDGGVNGSLNLDSHGKTLSFLLLDMQIEVPANLAAHLKSPQPTELRAA